MNRYFGLHTLEGEWHSLLPRYLLLAERLEGKRVLDIGCGSGIGSSLLLELGAKLVNAVDHRPAVLELARMKHAKQGLDFHVMFWEELDFPDDTFDLVICLDPASPVTDPSLIAEVRRVLKPEGEYVCAIEHRRASGMEKLLPRYGYSDAAENVQITPSDDVAPSLDELKSFEHREHLVQRPVLGFRFQGTGDDADQEGLAVDQSLGRREDDPPDTEVWFCSDIDLKPLPHREIRLPYFSVIERLGQVLGDLQMRQGGRGEEALFDEIIEEQTSARDDEYDRERVPTNEFRVVRFDEDSPTLLREPAVDFDEGSLHGQVQELAQLYHRVRADFEAVVGSAQSALQERDEYIGHLVSQIQRWETHFREIAPPGTDLDEQTSVFDASEEQLDAIAEEADLASEDSDAETQEREVPPELADGGDETSEEPADEDSDADDAEPGDDDDSDDSDGGDDADGGGADSDGEDDEPTSESGDSGEQDDSGLVGGDDDEDDRGEEE